MTDQHRSSCPGSSELTCPSSGSRDVSREEVVRRDESQGAHREVVLDHHDLPAPNPAESFERIARLTSEALNAPIALITFLGQEWQWFNAAVGTDLSGGPVNESFCVYTVQEGRPFIVEDAKQDERFAHIPAVDGPHQIRFYAGYPLKATDGTRIGTLCVYDVKPRTFDEDQVRKLEDLALLATNEIALRRSLIERRSTEQRLEGVMDTSVAAILVLSRQGEIVYLNDRTRTLFADSAREQTQHLVPGTNLYDLELTLRDPDGEPLTKEEMMLYRVFESGQAVRGQRRIVEWGDDRRIIVEMNAAPLVNRRGDVEEVAFSIDDITEQYYNERLRAHQRDVLEQIAHSADLTSVLNSIVEMMETLRPTVRSSIFLLDDNRLFEGAAPSLVHELKPPPEGASVSPDYGSCVRSAYYNTEVITEDIATDPYWRGARKVALENDIRSCWSIPIRGDEEVVLGTLALFWPTTGTPNERDKHLGRIGVRLAGIAIEHAQSQRELRESEANFQQLAENIDEVFWLRTRDEMLYVSPAYERIWGRPYAGVHATSDGHLGLTHPSDIDRVREAYRQSWNSGTRFDEEYRIARPDGTVRWIHAVAWQFSIEGAPEQRQAGYAVDVTERVRRRHELLAAKQEAEELNRLKTAFLANMSHEIRTPLTSIIGFAEVLEEELGDEHGRAPELIHRSGQRLMNTLDSVLQLSRLEADAIRLHPEETDLCSEVRDTLAMFETQATSSGIELKLDAPDDLVEIQTDPLALQRILQNLVGNAVKFTEDGYVGVCVRPTGEQVQIDVEDTGIGIGRDFTEKIFEAFEQESTGPGRTFEGSGLGLTVVKRLVNLMGGTIDVESEPGEGTRFTVTLPKAGPSSPVTPLSEVAPHLAHSADSSMSGKQPRDDVRRSGVGL